MSIKSGMKPVHPGEVLRDKLEVLAMSARALAEALNVPGNRITAILKGQRGITADTSLRLARYLGTTPEFWLNLQKLYELRVAQVEAGEQIEKTIRPRKVAA
jgi:addiction module HigA family antidote